jgi:hypothetical protein
MNKIIGRYDVMSFVTYTPVDDAEERGYDQWLVDVDNPFFNSADGCAGYTNWKVIDDAGVNPQFSYFDFFGMTGKDAVDKIWNDEGLSAFRREWRVKWGRDRDLGRTPNIPVNLCGRLGEPQAEAKLVILVPAKQTIPTQLPGHETWSVYGTIRGDVVFPAFHLKFADDPAEFDKTKEAQAGGGPAALLGLLLAGPD